MMRQSAVNPFSAHISLSFTWILYCNTSTERRVFQTRMYLEASTVLVRDLKGDCFSHRNMQIIQQLCMMLKIREYAKVREGKEILNSTTFHRITCHQPSTEQRLSRRKDIVSQHI